MKIYKPIVLSFWVKSGVSLYLLEIQVSLSPTLSKNKKVEHHIRMRIYKFIDLNFWVKSGVNLLYVD